MATEFDIARKRNRQFFPAVTSTGNATTAPVLQGFSPAGGIIYGQPGRTGPATFDPATSNQPRYSPWPHQDPTAPEREKHRREETRPRPEQRPTATPTPTSPPSVPEDSGTPTEQPPTGDPSGLNDFYKFIGDAVREAIENPTGFGSDVVEQTRERLMKAAREEIESDAQRRGIFFSSVPTTTIGRAESDIQSRLLEQEARAFAEARARALELGIQFARFGAGQDAASRQAAINLLQLLLSGEMDFGDIDFGNMPNLPQGSPEWMEILGKIFPEGSPEGIFD